jgi:hypothetical protein
MRRRGRRLGNSSPAWRQMRWVREQLMSTTFSRGQKGSPARAPVV